MFAKTTFSKPTEFITVSVWSKVAWTPHLIDCHGDLFNECRRQGVVIKVDAINVATKNAVAVSAKLMGGSLIGAVFLLLLRIRSGRSLCV